MDDSIGFVSMFFLPFIAYLIFSRIRLDEDHAARRRKLERHGRQFCGVGPNGHEMHTDPFSLDVPAPRAPEITLPEAPTLRCWDPVQ
jgi:hypothetical protein